MRRVSSLRDIYGHPPSSQPGEFRDRDAALEYLQHTLPFVQGGEYRSSRAHSGLHSIIFSFDGELLAELIVAGDRPAGPSDKQAYAKARTVYLIAEIRIFRDGTKKVADIGLSHGGQDHTDVPDAAYDALKQQAAGFEWIIVHA